MFLSTHHMVRALAVLLLMLFLFSCATYNNRITKYYEQVTQQRYEKAYAALDQNKLLQQKRNRLLYLLEKGKMAHLLQQYENSNQYFNEADLFIEDVRTTVKDIALGTLLNPMMQTYKGEDFEKFMVHYYKALNYLYLRQPNEAMVEARRISLESFAQQDKTNNNENRYSDDAFSLMMQAIIYENSGDMNNAFIAYRNAADLFMRNDNSWYSVKMPEQLKKDVLRTAWQNGFTDELGRYEQLFNMKFQPEEKAEGGELILFWENGMAPVKREQNFFFTLTKNGVGNFVFTDAMGGYNIPFDFSNDLRREDVKLEDLRSFRVAFPKYEEQPIYYGNAILEVNNQEYQFEQAENINSIAFATLKERFLKEMTTTLSRLAVKKIAEAAARPKKDDKNKEGREALALAIQIFNFASEKADTRNWQSLPHTIYYTRIPLQRGVNVLQVKLSGRGLPGETVNLVAEGNGHLQIKNLITLR
jgi:uncharacterized protein